MTIGKAISTIRMQKKISQKELAGKCGLTVVALSKIERGITVPRHETVEALAIGLNVPMESLLLNQFLAISNSLPYLCTLPEIAETQRCCHEPG